ncbi:hypothetical protein LSAT2_026756 [Lamellibrachia satsuma]|nr:hypothetical protein LSAT2_026756 [Lamellibrachia satsuma]
MEDLLYVTTPLRATQGTTTIKAKVKAKIGQDMAATFLDHHSKWGYVMAELTSVKLPIGAHDAHCRRPATMLDRRGSVEKMAYRMVVSHTLSCIADATSAACEQREYFLIAGISQFLERKNIEVDTLHQLLLKVNRLITFDEVWTIADYMIQGGDSKIDFNQFMYAISVNTPTVAHIYRTTFTDRQWEVFTAISRFIRMHKWITPLQRLTKLIESTSREVRWREHLYEKRTLTPTSTRSKRYWAKSMKLNKLWPFSRVSRYYKKFALPSLTSRPKKSILKRKTNVTQEMGAVFVPSSETGFSGMNFTSSESSSEKDYAPRLAVRGICNSRKAVSLPKLKIRRNLAGLDPETLRSKRRNDVMLYTDQVREFYAKQSLKCWNGMRVHDIQSPILQERFQEIYASYMPCRKEDVFVRAPYTPPPLSMAYLTDLRRIIDHPTMLLSKPVRRRNARPESVLFSATDGFTPLSRDRS